LQSRLTELKTAYGHIEKLLNISGYSWDSQDNKVTGAPSSVKEYLESNKQYEKYFKATDIDLHKLRPLFE
jgi:hypothetical protein